MSSKESKRKSDHAKQFLVPGDGGKVTQSAVRPSTPSPGNGSDPSRERKVKVTGSTSMKGRPERAVSEVSSSSHQRLQGKPEIKTGPSPRKSTKVAKVQTNERVTMKEKTTQGRSTTPTPPPASEKNYKPVSSSPTPPGNRSTKSISKSSSFPRTQRRTARQLKFSDDLCVKSSSDKDVSSTENTPGLTFSSGDKVSEKDFNLTIGIEKSDVENNCRSIDKPTQMDQQVAEPETRINEVLKACKDPGEMRYSQVVGGNSKNPGEMRYSQVVNGSSKNPGEMRYSEVVNGSSKNPGEMRYSQVVNGISPDSPKEEVPSSSLTEPNAAASPMTCKVLPFRRTRRSMSDVTPSGYQAFIRGRRASEIPQANFNSPGGEDNRKVGANSVDSLRVLNDDLRDQVTRMRTQLEAQMGHIKQAQWHKVVYIRQVRQQEQQRSAMVISEQRTRMEKEKARELDLLREQLVLKAECDLQKLTRFKDAEINKLKLEIESKDAMLQRLLGCENRHTRVRLNIDDRKSKLLDELKELRQAKRELEDSLNNASFAERNFSNDLRKNSASFESELARVKREAQIENGQLIEQLKNKDKLISQLEKDLGHRWGAAQFAALERRRSEGGPLPPGGTTPSHPLRALPDGSECPDPLQWTPTSAPDNEGVEEAWSKLLMEGNSMSKQDLLFKLKDSRDRTKELLEKCRSYLQQNKELTAQNRAFQESSERANQGYKKAQEILEHSKLQVLHLTRQLSHTKMEKSNLEQQARGLDRLREEIAEDKKMINALRKACSDKDRRIELIQHRKKRRRVLGSAEKQMIQSAGLRETYYGYEEDPKMAESSDQSLGSSIASTISDEEVWDEELSREEMERNYQRLMMEHMDLQRIHAMLQIQTGSMMDPQREHMDKTSLQNDLFSAQCRIEHLEKLVNEIGEGEVKQLLMERETILEANRQLNEKARNLEKGYRQMQKELTNAEERSEELEFRLMELEQCEDRDQSTTCDVSSTSFSVEAGQGTTQTTTLPIESAQSDHSPRWREVHQDMEQLRQELVILLKGKGKEAEAVLKKVDQLKETERKMEGLEVMARELQFKVIGLQQEKDSLQDKLLMMEESTSGKGKHSASLSAAQERKENLELKATTVENQEDLGGDRKDLMDELECWKAQCHALKSQLDAVARKRHSQRHQQEATNGAEPVHVELVSSSIQKTQTAALHSSRNMEHSQTPVSSGPEFNKKASHRKSKSRSDDDPTLSKRRRSSKDHGVLSHKNRKLKSALSMDDSLATPEYDPVKKSSKLSQDFSALVDKFDVGGEMRKRISFLEGEVLTLKRENKELVRQVKEGVEERGMQGEKDQMMRDHLSALEKQLDLLHKENCTLSEQLRQRVEEFQYQRDDLHPRISELEEYCEDLQERLHRSETCERQLREKVKFVEGSMDDAENSELATREQCRQLLASDLEAKKQIQALHRTGQELKDIVLEKEFVEQALRDKVDFLQKAEAASVQRIEELEQIEKELREQLEQKSDGIGQSQRDSNKIQELKHQMTFLQTDNQALSARVSELEENEETLRENWRRVADEDFNRTQCLEEKVKMLETLNKELKSKLSDAQEYFVINTVPQIDTSLAAELAESQHGQPNSSEDELDGEMAPNSVVNIGKDGEKKGWKEKLGKLERQLSEVTEQKNTKIESLQEQLVGLRETEIKLSETISEMEMTERELKAKLALYESSEVTVEKMLKYQSKIEELRTSQESLLDQLESMENQEMSLQDQMQEMERTLRGKIVTLEVEMKRFKQKELKNAGRIRDLEKQESSLTAKVDQQAEKENNLYMKINNLMEELKSTKTNLEKARELLEEREEKVRQVKLLEVKLLEIEMDYGKKTNELNTKLRHQEEEFRQKDLAREEEIRSLHGEVAQKELQEKEVRKNWENDLVKRNTDTESAISAIQKDLDTTSAERDNLQSQVNSLTKTVEGLKSARTSLEDEIDSLKNEIDDLTHLVSEKEASIFSLSKQVESEKETSRKAEEKSAALEMQLSEEKQKVSETEEKLESLKLDIESKVEGMKSFVAEKEGEHQCQLESLEKEVELKESRVKELEVELKRETELVMQLQSEKDQLNCEASENKAVFTESAFKLKNFSEDLISRLDKDLNQKVNVMFGKLTNAQDNMAILSKHMSGSQQRSVELESEKASIVQMWEDKLASLREEQSSKENELNNKVKFLDTQLQQEVMEKEVQQSSFQQVSHEKESALKSDIENLQHEVESHKLELIGKLSELENKNKEHCEVSLKLSELRHSYKTLQNESDQSKQSFLDAENRLKSLLSQKDEKLIESNQTVQTLTEEVELLKESIKEKDDNLHTVSQHKDLIIKEKEEESQKASFEAESLKDKVAVIDDLNQILSSKSSQVDEITVKLEHTEQELQKLTLEHRQVQSQHLSQSSEHQQTIQKYTEDIEQLQSVIEQKDQTIFDKEQTCKEIQSELDDLNLCLQDRDRELQQVETQVADVTMKLKQVENKYRELESKCASLELTLEERYAVAEDAKKVLAKKEIHCQQLEGQLEKAERNLETLQEQISVGSDDSKVLSESLKSKDKELDHLQTEILRLNQDLERNSQECSVLETKLTEECKILQDQYAQEKEKADTMENCLLETEKECQNLQEQVIDFQKCAIQMEDDQSNLKDQLVSLKSSYEEGQAKIQILNRSLEEYEAACREKNARINSLEGELSEGERSNLNTKEQSKLMQDQFNKSSADLQALQTCLEEVKNDLETERKEKMEIKSQLEITTSMMENSMKEVELLNSQLASSKEEGEDAERRLKDYQTEISSLSSQLDASQSLCEEKSNKLLQLEEDIRLAQIELDGHKLKLEEVTVGEKNNQDRWQETQQEFSDAVLKINQLEDILRKREAEVESLKHELSEQDQALDRLNNKKDALMKSNDDLNLEIYNKENKMKTLASDLDELTASMSLQQEENKSLISTVKEFEEELNLTNENYAELINANQELSFRLSNLEKTHNDLQPKLQNLQETLAECSQDRDTAREELSSVKSEKESLEDENQQLHKELDTASREFDSLRVSCEESKTNIERKLYEMSEEKQVLEESFEKQSIALNTADQRMADFESREEEAATVTLELKQVRMDLLTMARFNEELEQEKAVLTTEINSLRNQQEESVTESRDLQQKLFHSEGEMQSLREKLSLTTLEPNLRTPVDQHDGDIVSQECIQVSFAPSLQASINADSTGTNEKQNDEIIDDRIEKLTSEINAFRLKDESYEQKVLDLEKALEDAKEKDSKKTKRIDELETIEKELREQIVDIEMTVIVPLETENQELKDEIGMVQQEKDEAIAKVSTWDDEVNGVDAVESAHQRLEESLVQVEELEKKNDILLGDIAKLESEKENLLKSVSEFEVGVAERDERLESLQEEVDRLLEVEKKVLVLEESETRLMDRVLDLEEHEQSLNKELEVLVREKEEFETVEHENQSKHKDLVNKIEYLEKKNQLLLDAEGRSMDKVIELEEEVARLTSELSSHRLTASENVSLADVQLSLKTAADVSISNINSNSISTQTSVPFQSNISSGANLDDITVNNLEEDLSRLSLPQETLNGDVSLQDQLLEIKKSNNILFSESQEKEAKISYLGDKLELLRDSEARLMEKLLESEEEVSRLKSDISKTKSDLDAKIEHLQEENEFLAGNVENYQKLYKEEKERTNDLQDRLMEETSRLSELDRTQKELADTQKMVQDIQCEYEEQLTDRFTKETELREEFSSLQTRHHCVEEELAAKCERETELRLRIETLESSEGELKAQLESLSLVKREEEESMFSDSGLSGDDPRARHDATKFKDGHPSVESSILRTSIASISLSPPRPSRHSSQQSTHQSDNSPPTLNRLSFQGDESHNPLPIQEDIVQRDLVFEVESSTQQRLGGSWDQQEYYPGPPALNLVNNQVSTAQSFESDERLRELEARNLELEARLRDAEVEKASLLADVASIRRNQNQNQTDLSENFIAADLQLRLPQNFTTTTTTTFGGGDSQRDKEGRRRQDQEEEGCVVGDRELDQSFSSLLSGSSSAMLEKPEDVLLHRIRELEGLDKHNKNQVSELEKDREILHEIARKDKASIHDLNVKIRELQLSERSLKEQVANLEVSENSLFTKCEELEAVRAQLEDRVHELEIHERRLRELVRKLKLDEERWLSKSGGFETAVAELSANEQQLKRHLQDVKMEKGGLSERADYLEARIRELESVETTLLARIQNYETNEVALQNRLVLLENSETASRSKASELDIFNKDLSNRMKKISDENTMMSQHLSQLHGQIQELDRRLLTSRDSELAFKQHVESLQKNESLLQKKVREYELRQIDSQSQTRELEQMLEINKDKISALQRSENRLKYRVQELEGLGAPIPGELTPSQRQKLPQKLEDCQKRIVVLQSQVENLQLQLRQALNTTQSHPTVESDDNNNNNVTIATEEYSQLHAKAAMLDEIMYQNEELERVNEELNDTILQLRDGKGACGHEVEIEVLKRRINSLKTFIDKLKSSLSEGQATSLSDPEQDSGPQGETLPARNLQVLESERVLQSVRGLNHDGKADTPSNGADHRLEGQAPVEEVMMQTQATRKMAAPSTTGSSHEPRGVKQEKSSKNNLEEPHWKAIEARKPAVTSDSRGGVKVTAERDATTASSPRSTQLQQGSSPEVEEVTLGLNLQSESELSSHYNMAGQNDTDSSCSPVAPPRKTRAKRASKIFDQKASSETESEVFMSPAAAAVTMAANQKHFDNAKSLPLMANADNCYSSSSPRKGHESQAPLSRFAEDSFYLPSSAQEGVDSLDDDEAPPLPMSGPPGVEGLEPIVSGRSSEASVSLPPDRRDSPDSLDHSTSGMSIRDRITMIEKNLRSDTQASSIGSRDDEDQLLFWKKKSSEYGRQVDSLDRENKFVKEDINRLEKELEEKRRYINTLEGWLTGTEDLLRNKNKQTDREMVEQLQLELAKLRKELKQAGYRSEDILMDPAALKTELDHRDKEIVSKRTEIESLTQEVKKWHKECRNIEGMRRTALDSLRQLEREVLGLQDAEIKLEASQKDLRNLKSQYESKQLDLQSVIIEKEDVEFALKSVIQERDKLKVDLRRTEQEKDELKPQLEDISKKLEDLSGAAAKNSTLQDQLDNMNQLLLQRTDKTREVYEENLNLRDRVNESEGELSRYRTLCDDFNNLSARYDEMEQFKNQALTMVQPLQLKVERLTVKCKEKDALLRRLGGELRRGLHRPSSALEELTRLERAMASEEYDVDNGEDAINGTTSPRNFRARSASMDELNFSHSDSDSVQSASSPNVTPTRRQRPTPYVNNRPRSAETVGSSAALRGQRGVHARSRLTPRVQRPPNVAAPKVFKGQFVAIADYDPALFSQSGRPRLELVLREGDQVTVTGPMDRHGYCEAEINGRTGLVPVIYLEASSQGPPPATVNGHAGQTSVMQLNHSLSPIPPADAYSSMHRDYALNGLSEREEELSHLRASMEGLNTPDPPHHLHIRGVTSDSLALAWLPPNLDQRGCNKGLAVTGYKVYVNNQEYSQVSDPQSCETVVKGLNLMYPVQLAVQCVCADGQVSPRTELVFEGMVTMHDADIIDTPSQLQQSHTRHSHSQKEEDTDLSSVLNSVQYKRGHKKTVIALYDYNPEQQSPHDYTAFELAFHAGDVISVYGEPRPDGFFHGEIEGKRGLIPACFVEDMPSLRRPFKGGPNETAHSSSIA